jgi:hypothetical protein
MRQALLPHFLWASGVIVRSTEKMEHYGIMLTLSFALHEPIEAPDPAPTFRRYLMVRSLAHLLFGASVMAAWGCTNGTPTNCTFAVTLAQHPGVVFHGTGVPAGGGNYSVDVVPNPTSCAIPTQASDPWITITPDVSNRYQISAAANTGARRTGTAYVGYQALIVDQAGTTGSGCTFQLIPANSSYTTAGGTGAFVIVPNDQRCGWSADRSMSGEDWSSVPVPIRGVGTAAIVFNVQSGTAAPQPPLPRQAEIRVTDSANAAVGSHAYSQQ